MNDFSANGGWFQFVYVCDFAAKFYLPVNQASPAGFKCYSDMATPGRMKVSDIRHILDLQIHARGFSAFQDIEIRRMKGSVLYRALAYNFEPAIPIFACKFCPDAAYSNILASCDEVGNVVLHNCQKPLMPLASLRAHNNAIFDVAWMPTRRKLLTMSGDHNVQLLDVGDSELNVVSVFTGHSKSVKTVDFMPSDPGIFATGSRDGNIIIWDSRCSKKGQCGFYSADQTITKAVGRAASFHPTSVTGLVFKDRNNLLACGSSDQFIRIYDMRKTHCAWKESSPKAMLSSRRNGFTDLKANPERTKLYASNINFNIVCYNLNSEQSDPIAEFTGHVAGSFYVKTNVSADGRYLISGSTDWKLNVWSTEKAELQKDPIRPIAQLDGHTSEVMSGDFKQHGRAVLASCADEGTIWTWEPAAPELSHTTKSLTSRLSDLSLVKSSGDEVPQTTPRTPPRKALISTQVIKLSVGKRKFEETSPNKMDELAADACRSPTMNLPNYVLEGTGPSHSCPPKQKENKQDWLTEIKIRSAGKQPQKISQARRRSSLQGKTTSSSRKTLLNYYKKSNKGIDDAQKV